MHADNDELLPTKIWKIISLQTRVLPLKKESSSSDIFLQFASSSLHVLQIGNK